MLTVRTSSAFNSLTQQTRCTFRRPQQPSCRLESQLPRSELKSQLTGFFANFKILSASGHDVIHVPGPIFYVRFLLWHLCFSHPPSARVNTCTQCVHLTNPCTKRKVLSVTKSKGKIYKTKSLRNYIRLFPCLRHFSFHLSLILVSFLSPLPWWFGFFV